MRNEAFWEWFEAEAAPKLEGRAGTFRKMFEHLDKLDRPVRIIETGTCYDPENWRGNGCSTILFDRYAWHALPGSVVMSVDVDPQAIATARKITSARTLLYCLDSVKFLADSPLMSVDLLYLDGSELDWSHPTASAAHHLAELTAAMPMIHPGTLVVVDDSPAMVDAFSNVEVQGKGRLVAQHMLEVFADIEFIEYQAGWTNVRQKPPHNQPAIDIREAVTRARGHVEAGRGTAAAALYKQILAETGTTTPTAVERVARGEAAAFFAKSALSHGQVGTAADWYREAVRVDPRATEYRVDLATRVYLPMGYVAAARNEAGKAARIDPDDPLAWHALGGIEHEMGNGEAALEAYQQQLRLAPDDPAALLDMAALQLDLGHYDAVEQICDRILFTIGSDRRGDAWHCLAMVHYRRGEHEAAIDMFNHAIAAPCRDVPRARWNKSLALHSIGRYREGWAEHQARADQKSEAALFMPMRRFVVPHFDFTAPPHADVSVHVHSEAGAGDNIVMARYLPILAKCGYDVRYEVNDDMFGLMSNSLRGVSVMRKAADYPGALGIPPMDYHMPIGSLPHVFGTDVDTVPWDGPYLRADGAAALKYGKILADWMPRSAFTVGLCWSAGIRDGLWLREYGKRKSMHLADLKPVFTMEEREPYPKFVSLQVGPERSENINHLFDVLPAKPEWADTAALINCLDLVVTVDTGVAHLAGAMGKPTWLMMHTEGSFHWMAQRPGASWNEASPWYPSVRIFRQERPHDWDDVVERVAAELSALLAKQAA